MFFGMSAELSNALGYATGFVVSYFAHKNWTFQKNTKRFKEFPKYAVSIFVAYGLNFLTLIFCTRQLDINPYASQLISGVVYVCASFVMLKMFAFSSRKEPT